MGKDGKSASAGEGPAQFLGGVIRETWMMLGEYGPAKSPKVLKLRKKLSKGLMTEVIYKCSGFPVNPTGNQP